MLIKKYISILLLIVNCSLPIVNCTAQPDKASIEKIGGLKYYIHHVEKGHTLYSISKMYSVDIEDIKTTNPDAEKGLSIGQVLKIPVGKINKKQAKDNPPSIEGEYLIHKVQKQETLFSLSKKYSIEIRDVITINPEVKEGLKIGQEIRIPITKVRHTQKENIIPAGEDSLVLHKVKKGETLFSIAKQHGVMVDSIRLLNSGLPGGLREGTTIRIPKLNEAYLEMKKKMIAEMLIVKSDSSVVKDIYNVALMLPFYVEINDSLKRFKKRNEEDRLYPPSLIAVEFYQGVLIALDSLAEQGVSVRLYVYDTKHSTFTVNELLKKEVMDSMDLFIGPLYKSNFELVSAFAKERGINVVCPVPQNNKILLGNSHVSKASPSITIQMEQLAKYVVDNFHNEKIVLINTMEKDDEQLVSTFRKKGNEALSGLSGGGHDSIHEVRMSSASVSGIKNFAIEDSKNILVVASCNQVFVSDILTKLYSLKKKYEFIVFGMDKWRDFENLDVEYLHKLHLHFASPTNIDYDNEQTGIFIRKFRGKFKTDPGKYGLLGFDIAWYYMKALNTYGTGFQDKLPEMKYNSLASSFDFFKTSPESGYENRYVYILMYQDFKLIKVN